MTTHEKPLLRGVEIDFGGHSYFVPALNFRQVRERADDIAAISAVERLDVNDLSLFERITRLVHTAMTRNYPDLKIEVVEDGLDLVNAAPAIAAVLGNSGVTEAPALQPSADQSAF
jgi:hypothetical protein